MSYVPQDSMSLWWLTDAQAQQTVAEIASQVAQWKAVFNCMNVRDADIELLAQYLDGAHLREQRAALKS